ncbi:MAG: phosphoenolpyruvate carboxykinase (GTP) [Candidatus Omnitrophica bacterium]|nr:phosphoenolpyruvate carboxykinase (GTP) [Candidatus Omnitrophota bacterium]
MDYYIQILKNKLKKEEFEKLHKIKNKKVLKFIAENIEICNPDEIFICSDTPDEIAHIKNMAIVSREESSALLTPGHTFHFDGYYDQGRDREVTKFLVPKGDKLSSALNQIDRDQGLSEIKNLLTNSMKGKTMIVRFLILGPAGSVFTIPCVECTDSWYVAHSVDLLYRHGYNEFLKLEDDEKIDIFFTLHSAGELDENMTSKNYDKKRIYIDYIKNTVYSVNTQYAGNSIGFKKLALRLAIRKAHNEGWLAEHFMIIGVYGPNKRKTYIAGAFPSACGKTSTAMLEGEKILSDDLAYVKNINGICKAVNVECGIFGIIQGVNPADDPLIYNTITSPNEIIFSNVLVKNGKVWWLDMGCELPQEGINYSGKWYKGKKDENGEEILPSHKNARYTISLKVLSNCDEQLENPEGVELGGIIFGGRDYRGYVPVQQGFDWIHGIISYGVALETETTFAIVGQEGKYEINIMSIQDFVSISLGNYIRNYIEFGKRLKKVPLVFGVNYFLRDLETGEFLNSRKDKHIWIKWMELKIHNDVKGIETSTGIIPQYEDLKILFKEVLNKDYSKEDYIKQFTIRVPENIAKIDRVLKFVKEKIEDAPIEVFEVLSSQKKRLLKAKEKFGDYISPEKFI